MAKAVDVNRVTEAMRSAISDDEIVELEKSLIRIPSYTMEETELGQFIVGFLSKEGIQARLQDVPVPDLAQTKSSRTSSHNVIGRLGGSGGGKSLMLNGHMDHGPWDITGRAVDDFRGWVRAPFEPTVEDGLIYGKGAQDEKGGICAMLAGAVALKRAGVPIRGDVLLCPVMGHKSHSIGTKVMMDSGIRADYGINTENSGNMVVPAHVGIVTADVQIRGIDPRMRSWAPSVGSGASAFLNAARFIEALGPEGIPHGPDGWTMYRPHSILKAWPDHRIEYVRRISHAIVEVGVFVKTVPGQDELTVKRDLERVVSQLQRRYGDFLSGGVDVELWGPPLDTPYENPVVQSVAKWHRHVTGERALVGPEGRWSAYGCGAVMGAAGIPTVIYGPGNHIHDPNRLREMAGEIPPDEYISIRELTVAARVMALTMADLCGGLEEP
ncbi:MAG: M20 family metallopeptidase [Armatimonadota bacterium]